MAARAFKLFGAHERAALAELLEEKVGQWARAWLPARARLKIECAPAIELAARLADAQWLFFAAPAEWWACAASPGEIDALAAELGGAGDAIPARSDIAAQAVRAALQELANGLLERSTAPTDASPDFSHRGSAAYAARVTLGRATLRMVCSPDWTLRALKERLPAPRPAALASRRAAIASRPVAVRVVAGFAELELAALRGLEVGDVITLEERIDRPLPLVISDKSTGVCGARLGARDGRRAAALTAIR